MSDSQEGAGSGHVWPSLLWFMNIIQVVKEVIYYQGITADKNGQIKPLSESSMALVKTVYDILSKHINEKQLYLKWRMGLQSVLCRLLAGKRLFNVIEYLKGLL